MKKTDVQRYVVERKGDNSDKERVDYDVDAAKVDDNVQARKDVTAEDIPDVVSHTWKVPDGGYGWVVVVSALVVSLIVDGLSYTFGLFLGEFERAFHEPKSKIALASSLQVGIYLFIGPLVSALTNRLGCRPVIILGSFVAGLAFIASSWSSDVTMLILTYGLVGGIGFGLMYLPTIVAVSIYFEERRALATGLAVCGSGIGTFILAPLTDYLLLEYNWRWTLLLLGGLVLQGMVFGALVRPLDLQREEAYTSSPEDEAVRNPSKENGTSTTSFREEDEGENMVVTMINKKISTSGNGRQEREEIPLIQATKQDNIIPHPWNDATHNTPHSVFSSTPAMNMNSNSQFSKAEQNKVIHSPPLTKPGHTPRRRTQSSCETVDIVRSPRARAHVPVGLALISLSDANLNQIREDVHLPLSRKDIHLSGPMPLPDSDSRSHTSDHSRGLYIQSIKSISSLAALDGLEVVGVESGSVWSCLPQSARETMEEMLGLSILKEKSYWCVLMGNFFCMLGFYVPFVYIPDRAENLGIPEDQAAFLISIIGITNTIGRVMTGVLINFFNLDCAMVTSVALFIAGVTTAAIPFCHSYPGLAAASAIFGVCVAAYISLCSVLLCELLGVQSLTNAFGFVILFRGVACIMGPPIAGALIDATGMFDPSFYVAGGMIVLGALAHGLLLTPCSSRRKIES